MIAPTKNPSSRLKIVGHDVQRAFMLRGRSMIEAWPQAGQRSLRHRHRVRTIARGPFFILASHRPLLSFFGAAPDRASVRTPKLMVEGKGRGDAHHEDGQGARLRDNDAYPNRAGAQADLLRDHRTSQLQALCGGFGHAGASWLHEPEAHSAPVWQQAPGG